MQSVWRRITQSQGILSGALLVGVSGFFANVLNLGVSVVIARVLHPVSYGAYSQLVGMFFVVALPGSALSVAVVRRATWYLAQNDADVMARWQRTLSKRTALLFAFFVPISLAGSFSIAHWLGHRSWLAVWVNALAAMTWALLNVERALMQARQRYASLASNFILEGLFRTALMMLGSVFGVTGIVAGLFAAIVVARLHAHSLVRLRAERGNFAALEHTGITTDLTVALLTLALMAALQFADVFLVGRYAPHAAGAYSAISQVAKTIVYGAIILGSFLLPETAIAARRGREAFKQLGLTAGLLAIPTSLLVGISVSYGRQFLTAVFGARYATAYQSLPLLIGAMAFLGGSTLLTTYLLGAGSRWATTWVLLGTVAGVWFMAGARGGAHATVSRDLVVQAVIFCGLVLFALLHKKGDRESR